MPKQELDLFEVPAGLAAEFRAGYSEVVGAEALDADDAGGLGDDGPNGQSLRLLPTFPPLERDRSSGPSSICAAVCQALTACLTHMRCAIIPY